MAADPQSGNRKRVLVVEDDPDFSVMLRDYLRGRGLEVTLLANGAEALRAILGADYDVIVCDMVMPRMAGDMFYDAVRRVKPHLCERFIFVTGHAESPKVKEFLAPVTERVLQKPFHLDDLAESIDQLLRDLQDDTRQLDRPAVPRRAPK
jgi:two-component system, cell cycle sensor histidine kinase and response regulator CckA